MTIRVHQTEAPVNSITRIAGEDVAGRIFVGIDGKKAGQGALALGVVKEETKSGLPMAVITEGTALVKAGCALTAGTEVTADADGKAIIAYDGEYINGVVMKDVDAEDQLVEVQLAGAVPATKSALTTTTTTTTAG